MRSPEDLLPTLCDGDFVDLDFTIDSAEPDDDVLMRLVETFNREHFGITFTLDECYKADDDTSFDGRPPALRLRWPNASEVYWVRWSEWRMT